MGPSTSTEPVRSLWDVTRSHDLSLLVSLSDNAGPDCRDDVGAERHGYHYSRRGCRHLNNSELQDTDRDTQASQNETADAAAERMAAGVVSFYSSR